MVFEQQPPKAQEQAPAAKPKNYGKVPAYINKYNQEREQVKRQKEIDAENAKMPPGTRLMPDDERIETLADLEVAKKLTND